MASINKIKHSSSRAPSKTLTHRTIKSLNKTKSEKNNQLSGTITSRNKNSIDKSFYESETNENFFTKFDIKLTNNEQSISLVLKDYAILKNNFEKQKNEMSLLNDKIKYLKNIIRFKNKELEILNKNNAEINEKMNLERQKSLIDKNDTYQIKEFLKKMSVTFKSTIDVFLNVLESLLITPNERKNNMSLVSKGGIFDQNDTIEYLNNEQKSSAILKEIQGILLRNLNYINNTFKLNIEKEIQNVDEWNIPTPSKPLIFKESEPLALNNIDSQLSLINKIDNGIQSPKFTSGKNLITFQYPQNGSSNNNLINFQSSVKDLIGYNEENDSNLMHSYFEKKETGELQKVEFNDNMTNFNYEIFEDFQKNLSCFSEENNNEEKSENGI